LALTATTLAADAKTEHADFFEKRVRPVLVEQCYKCHSAKSEKLKGGLLLDSREAMLKGGDTGPALAPGDLDKSLIIEAVRWQNKDLQMPPKNALDPSQVRDIETWVRDGAEWPDDPNGRALAKKPFDLQERKKQHWCWQAPIDAPPPAVKDIAWPRSAIDRFILAKLEEKGLKPAPDTTPATLLRRLYFDLTGLPPTPQDVEAFLHECSSGAPADNQTTRPSDNQQAPAIGGSLSPHPIVSLSSPNTKRAIEHVVDRLLASPHFGERWARHWLDLVRYSETRGHEFDYLIPNAWEYRDYVIRALNSDVPYNQFAAEHIAGDLLPPRLNPQTGANESILGTGFWFFNEEVHSPVDIRQDEADRMDNRLDVMAKTFLGVTVGCARCHDHKFDAISQHDYYALQGFLISSGYRQARFETLDHNAQIARELEHVRDATRPELLKAVADAVQPRLNHLADALVAAQATAAGADSTPHPIGAADRAFAEQLAGELESALGDPQNPLHPFARLAGSTTSDDPGVFLQKLATLIAGLESQQSEQAFHFSPEQIVADYTRPGLNPWIQDGVSFGSHPVPVGGPLWGNSVDHPLLGINTLGAAIRDPAWKSLSVKDSERDPARLGEWERSGQTLRTPDVTLKADRLWYLVKGAGHAYAAVNSHVLINGPLHGALLKDWKAPDGQWHWVEQRLGAYVGHRLHVEFCPADDGDFAVALVVQSSEKPPLPFAPAEPLLNALHDESIQSPRLLAKVTQRVLLNACEKLRAGQLGDNAVLADWLVRKLDLFAPAGSREHQRLEAAAQPLLASQADVLAHIRPYSRTAPAMFDGSGVNEFVLVRGQGKNPGVQVPRRFLEAIAGANQPEIRNGSGRLELAKHIVDPANPLTARVIVNRVWYHLFGRGIVPTVDNFGVLGQPPSHRELLDSLAVHFVRDQGWSLKKLIREIVLSRAYQMSSRPEDPAAEQADPDNILLHRANVRRLEGEAIRDAMLTASGRLDPSIGGPSVPVYVSEFMEGRGRPKSGPLDGNGRRSIYVAVRRNFLPPMMLAFDTPIPFNTIGHRNVSNVPAQALILMNDPFVVGQAKVWAEGLPANLDAAARIQQMYLRAFSRPATNDELADATEFLDAQRKLYGAQDAGDTRVWADFAHVLFNVKEFIYLN
jgi:hypothetical protein